LQQEGLSKLHAEPRLSFTTLAHVTFGAAL